MGIYAQRFSAEQSMLYCLLTKGETIQTALRFKIWLRFMFIDWGGKYHGFLVYRLLHAGHTLSTSGPQTLYSTNFVLLSTFRFNFGSWHLHTASDDSLILRWINDSNFSLCAPPDSQWCKETLLKPNIGIKQSYRHPRGGWWTINLEGSHTQSHVGELLHCPSVFFFYESFNIWIKLQALPLCIVCGGVMRRKSQRGGGGRD